MPIATHLAAAAVAAAAPLAATPVAPAPLPVIVSVSVTTHVSSRVVDTMLDETSAIWRAAGVSFVWRRTSDAVATPASGVSVTVTDQRGLHADGALPLGWIRFDGANLPEHDIYLSTVNARTLLDQFISLVAPRRVVMPIEEDGLLGRALGRALAHELGHYLLRSKEHSPRGLMQARRSSFDFFSTERVRFGIDAAQRQSVAARLAALHAGV